MILKSDIKHFFILLALAIALALLFVGCNTTRQLNKLNRKDARTVADWTRTTYPCITTNADTIVTTKDSTVYIDIECPENMPSTDYIKGNTVYKVVAVPKNKIVRVPYNLPIREVVITKKIKDSAEVFALQDEIRHRSDSILILKTIIEFKDKKIGVKNKWLLGSILLNGLLIFGLILILKRKS